MKQYYHTVCRLGRSQSGESGWRVRAASAGIEPERLKRIELATGQYSLEPDLTKTPTGMPDDPGAFHPALVDTDTGRRPSTRPHGARRPGP